MEDMGSLIKELRTKNNMTLEELGDKVGVGKSTVRKWENGIIANMRRDKIAKVAKALNTTPGYLAGWEEIDNELDNIKDKTTLYIKLFESFGYQIVLKDKKVQISTKDKTYIAKRDEFMTMLQRCYRDMVWTIDKMLENDAEEQKQSDTEAYLPNAAHERTDVKVTDEMQKHDDDIMDDDNF